MRYCLCRLDGRRPVTIRIDSTPGNAEFTVSFECDRCEMTILIEKTALVSSAEIPVLMELTVEPEGPYYELTARAESGDDEDGEE